MVDAGPEEGARGRGRERARAEDGRRRDAMQRRWYQAGCDNSDDKDITATVMATMRRISRWLMEARRVVVGGR